MRIRAISVFSFVGALLALTACQQLDLSAPASAERVLVGTVTTRNSNGFSPDAEVVVRVLDVSRGDSQPEVLGEQTIKAPATWPVSFRIEFQADDGLLLHGVAVDARISVGGKLRYTTRTAHPVTVGNVGEQHVLEVEPTAQP